jgi:H+/Cl- antiporter ClcA
MLSSALVSRLFPSARRTSLQWPRLIALTAAVAALLIMAMGVTLWHQDSPGTICSICYAAHSPALRSAPASTASGPLVFCWVVARAVYLDRAEPESLQSPPRGPPSA